MSTDPAPELAAERTPIYIARRLPEYLVACADCGAFAGNKCMNLGPKHSPRSEAHRSRIHRGRRAIRALTMLATEGESA